jgi:mannose-6-phosphate isomerase-like protein (cupin superfamily)
MAAMTSHSPFTTAATISHADGAATTSVLGGSIAIRLRAADTDGRIGLIEQVIPAGFPGPALHVHPTFEETFYVQDGSLAFRVGDDTCHAGPGTVAHIPRGVPHTFANPGRQPAQALVIVSPAGFEDYFEALAGAIAARGGMPPVAEVVELGIAHGSVPA